MEGENSRCFDMKKRSLLRIKSATRQSSRFVGDIVARQHEWPSRSNRTDKMPWPKPEHVPPPKPPPGRSGRGSSSLMPPRRQQPTGGGSCRRGAAAREQRRDTPLPEADALRPARLGWEGGGARDGHPGGGMSRHCRRTTTRSMLGAYGFGDGRWEAAWTPCGPGRAVGTGAPAILVRAYGIPVAPNIQSVGIGSDVTNPATQNRLGAGLHQRPLRVPLRSPRLLAGNSPHWY